MTNGSGCAPAKNEGACEHELKLTGMYEPFSVACKKCGSLHFNEDEFDTQQAKIGGMPYGTYGGYD